MSFVIGNLCNLHDLCAVFLLHDLCCFCVFSLLFFLTTVLMGWCVFIRVLVLLINAKNYSSSVFLKKDCMLLYKLQYLFQL